METHEQHLQANLTAQTPYLPSSDLSSDDTGSNENLSGIGTPSGRPRWLISTTDFAPWSKQCLMVGTAALILEGRQTEKTPENLFYQSKL